MTLGIDPDKIDAMSLYDIEIYNRIFPLYLRNNREQMEYAIKKALSEMMR